MLNKPGGGGGGLDMFHRWFYHGPDNEIHGPYTSQDMFMWAQSGYFNESLPIRVEHDDRFHSLGDWTRLCNGKSPFSMKCHVIDVLLNQLTTSRQQAAAAAAAMMMVPPGLAPPFPPPVHRYNAFPVHPNGHNNYSQPPSEPIDTSSLSHTPDSETEYKTNGNGILQRHAAVSTEIPSIVTKTASTNTDPKETKDKSCQTTPLIVGSKDAARILSELFGQVVHIT